MIPFVSLNIYIYTTLIVLPLFSVRETSHYKCAESASAHL